MNLRLRCSEIKKDVQLKISGSKSETNRLLLLQAIFPLLRLENQSDSDDSIAMRNALKPNKDYIDIGHAGTAMRFLTAYFATQPNRSVILTGSARMKERPIKILVDALTQLGCSIRYLEKDGFPPLQIDGRKIEKFVVAIDADVSSQYISALLLVAPSLPNGLRLTLNGEITSKPYIKMTLALLEQIGAGTIFDENSITVSPHQLLTPTTVVVESDWSSASYFYSIVALSPAGTQVALSSFRQSSLQGDSNLVTLYERLGVDTKFEQNTIILTRQSRQLSAVNCSLHDTPDLAQTIAVTCLGLGLECKLTGLHTLQIKETNRLVALKNELEKVGGKVEVTSNSLHLAASSELFENASIKTYDDHRMAMAFAPLAVLIPIIIEDADVVSKSYRAFWKDLAILGFDFDKQP
jgi:3-phosphoshikimate 1-carboxyvinyltransferase